MEHLDRPPSAGTQTTENRVPDAEAELDSYLEALNNTAIVATTDRSGRIRTVNDKFCEISGYNREELLGVDHRLLNSGHHAPDFFRDMWRTIGSGAAWHAEICNRAKNGQTYWVDTTIVPRRSVDGRRVGYVSIRYDITNRKLAQQALREENLRRERAEELLREILDSMPGSVAAYDTAEALVLFNQRFDQLYEGQMRPGMSMADVLALKYASGILRRPTGDPLSALAAQMRSTLGGGKYLQRFADGRWMQVEQRRSPRGYSVSVETDVTEIKVMERKARREAERDELTGLYNRRAFLSRLARTSKRGANKIALCLIDLDRFKEVNDSLGHEAGDHLLQVIAHRMRQGSGRGAVLARLGGDEFAMICQGTGWVGPSDERAQALLAMLQEPVLWRGRSIGPAASIGILVLPASATPVAELLRRADLALYAAKNSGRSTVARYSARLSREAELASALEQDLAKAIDQERVCIALQPQIRMETCAHAGFEALLRWKRNGQMVAPPEIVAAAMRASFTSDLTLAVAGQALASAHAIGRAGFASGVIAINVAGPELSEERFLPDLCQLIDRFGIERHLIELEITERVVIDGDGTRIAEALKDCAGEGLRIALDDFGTGYASLSHLTRLPVHRLKIDQSFVRTAASDQANRSIVSMMIDLAHDLGISVVAEGIETEEQFRLLASLGCDIAQGYLIGRPQSLSQLKQDYLSHLDGTGRSVWRAPWSGEARKAG